MSDRQFFQSRMGRTYYEATMPNLVRQLERMNDLLEQLVAQLVSRGNDEKS